MPDRKLKTLEILSVAANDVAGLRSSPAAVAKLLGRKTGRSSLGRYWHGVQYLLAGGAKDVRAPLLWLTNGGEVLGRTELGEVRYLAPEQVAPLAKAFADESPDDLGDGVYDETAMDAAGIYPGCWEKLAQTYDPLGTLRELYSYAREFFQARVKDRKGVVLFFGEEDEAFDEEDFEDDKSVKAPAAPESEPAPPAGTIFTGRGGRYYTHADAASLVPASLLQQVDAGLEVLGYSHVGDFTGVHPALAGGAARSFVSSDRTSAAFVLMSAERGVASTTFSSRLAGDALVQVSDAFMLEKKKVKFFGSTVSRGTPPVIHAAFLDRRRALAGKHGAAVAIAPTLEAVVQLFELYWSKITAGR